MAAQTLFDDLAGAFGHPVNRPALNAFVANAQAQNALRSQETEEAIQKAIAASNINRATTQLPGDLQAETGANGQALYPSANVPSIADQLIGHYGNSAQVGQGQLEAQQFQNRGILGNSANLNTPQDTAASAAVTGKVPGPYAVPQEYAIPPGVTPPQVQQTPLGAADVQKAQAQAAQAAATAKLTASSVGGTTNLQDMGAINMAIRAVETGTQPNYAIFGSGPGAQRARNVYSAAFGYRSLHPDATPEQIAAMLSGPQGAATAGALQHSLPPGTLQAPPPAAGTTPAPGAPNTQTPDSSVLPLVQKVYQDWSGEGKNGQRLIGYRTAANSVPIMGDLITALGNGNNTLWNAAAQKWGAVTGKAPPTNMQMAPQFFSTEVMRFLRGSGVFTGEEVNRLNNVWSVARSPQQLGQALNLTRQFLTAGANGMETSYNASMRGWGGQGGFKSFQDLLGGQAPTAGGAGPSAPTTAPPGALAYLAAHPNLAPMFKAKYGYLPGAQ